VRNPEKGSTFDEGTVTDLGFRNTVYKRQNPTHLMVAWRNTLCFLLPPPNGGYVLLAFVFLSVCLFNWQLYVKLLQIFMKIPL